MRALRVLLDTLGVKIDPEQIETAWAQSKDALPKLAAAFDEMNARLARIEKKLDTTCNPTVSQASMEIQAELDRRNGISVA